MADHKDNRGAQELRRLFPDRGATVTLAEMFGVKQSVASRWRSGDRTPDATNRQAIKDRLKIDWTLWDEPIAEVAPAPTGTHGGGS